MGWEMVLTSAKSSKVFLAFSLQGRLDALWALLRRQYDRVSLMRPQQGDEVGEQMHLRAFLSRL